MRRATQLLIVSALALGCRDGKGARGGRCDLDRLAAHADKLATLSPDERDRELWPGVVEACGSALPKGLDERFDGSPGDAGGEEELSRLRREACPDWKALAKARAAAPASERGRVVYEGCRIERYGILAEDEVDPWTPAEHVWMAHAWLLDQGLAEDKAVKLSRALYELERRSFGVLEPAPALRWPLAQGLPAEGGVLVEVSARELRFEGRTLVVLKQGALAEHDVREHLIPALYDALEQEVERSKAFSEARGEDWDGRLVFSADAQLPFSTLVDLVYTAGTAGFRHYGVVVIADTGELPRYLPFEPPTFQAVAGRGVPATKYEQAFPDILSVELAREQLSLARTSEGGESPQVVSPVAAAPIEAAARSLRGEHPTARQVVVSAEGDVPLQSFVLAIAAARGPECGSEPAEDAGCLLPLATIVSGRAHRYRAEAFPIAKPEHDVWGGLDEAKPGEGTLGLGELGTIKGDANAGDSKGGPVPRVRPGKHEVVGRLDEDIIRRIVRAHINELRSCYNAGLARDPKLEGTLTVDFVIAGTGKVSSAEVVKDELGDGRVGACAAKAFERWKFPRPIGGGEVEVSYPIIMTPGPAGSGPSSQGRG